MSGIALSLIIPCYNEAANLPLLIGRLAEGFKRSNVEVILVDNGSTDESPNILSEATERHPSLRSVRVDVNQGYGHGIVVGLREARGRYLGWTHADLQTDPEDVLRALTLLEKAGNPENIFVKGRRHGRPLADIIFTMGMSVFESVLFRSPLWDINAQPNIFPRSFFETWSAPPQDFSLDLFAYVMALRAGLRIERFPVRFGKRAHGTSHWNINWKAKVKFIKRTVAFSFQLLRNWRKGQ